MQRLICLVSRAFLALVLCVTISVNALSAQEFSASARVVGDDSHVVETANGLAVTLALTQAVPFRLFTLDSPRRLIVDFREVNWDGLDHRAFLDNTYVSDLRAGTYRPGWSRIVLTLAKPAALQLAEMRTDPTEGSAVLVLSLVEVTEDAFAAGAGAPDDDIWGEPSIAAVAEPIRRQTGDRPLTVVLDPGHGGIDPGAEHDDLNEADLMLQFARVLKETLIRAGGFNVVLTRDDDVFVPLETRVSIARHARADVLISLHADALSEGQASGATVYTLSEEASDEASARLAERHDRADLLAGIDLSQQDDVIAGVLMELARLETAPRSERLANRLVDGIVAEVGRMYKHPHQHAGFSVLKAPDIPSVLVELGFLSSPRDLADLTSPDWQQEAAAGIRNALIAWAAEDAAEAQLIRQ